MSKPSYEDVVAALEALVNACRRGRLTEYGPGGMALEAQLRRSTISGVAAYAVEDAAEVLDRCKDA